MRLISVTRVLTLCLGALVFSAATVAAADWPQFRGPGGRGQSSETGLPAQWNAETNIVWKANLPGPGASSAVTFGDRIFLTCYSGYGMEEDRDAGVFVLAARPEFELLAHNTIETDTSIFNASPAVAGGRLLLRSDRALYCIVK